MSGVKDGVMWLWTVPTTTLQALSRSLMVFPQSPHIPSAFPATTVGGSFLKRLSRRPTCSSR